MATSIATRSRSATISKADMEASRLVFVFVKDVKPKRKVAVPVPDGYTWVEFIQQVKSKLRISGVKEVYLASSGQKVVSLDELQDIDELCVVEGQDPYANGPAPVSSEAALRSGTAASTSAEIKPHSSTEFRSQLMAGDKHKVVVADGGSPVSAADDKKYAKRPPPWKRQLQRLFPSLFAPGLPISTKDVAGSEAAGSSANSGRRVRRRRSPFNARNVLLALAVASCLATMLWFMLRSGVNVT